jgi:hypothetical protein
MYLSGFAKSKNESAEENSSLKCDFYHEKLTLNKNKIDRDCDAFEDF